MVERKVVERLNALEAVIAEGTKRKARAVGDEVPVAYVQPFYAPLSAFIVLVLSIVFDSLGLDMLTSPVTNIQTAYVITKCPHERVP